MYWGSLFQAETTKERSPIEESLAAGMINRDDAAESGCFRPGTSATRRTSNDQYPGAVPYLYAYCFKRTVLDARGALHRSNKALALRVQSGNV